MKQEFKGTSVPFFKQSKCLTGSTLISADSSLKRIDTIRVNDLVWSLGKKLRVKEITLDYNQVTRLSFSLGPNLNATEDHVHLVLRDSKLQSFKTSELLVGDIFMCPTSLYSDSLNQDLYSIGNLVNLNSDLVTMKSLFNIITSMEISSLNSFLQGLRKGKSILSLRKEPSLSAEQIECVDSIMTLMSCCGQQTFLTQDDTNYYINLVRESAVPIPKEYGAFLNEAYKEPANLMNTDSVAEGFFKGLSDMSLSDFVLKFGSYTFSESVKNGLRFSSLQSASLDSNPVPVYNLGIENHNPFIANGFLTRSL